MSSILITGGNRGIGFAIAQVVGTRIPSSTIILACRSVPSGREAVDKLRAAGVKSTLDVVAIDIEDIESINAAVKTVEDKYGKLDVLINNAATVTMPSSQTLPALKEHSNQTFNMCVTSNILVTAAFTPLLRKSSWPRVIMNSSNRGSLTRSANKELPALTVVDYCVSKAALNMLTIHYQLAENFSTDDREKITFWAVNPGHTKTGFNNYRGVKDPVDSAEPFVRLLESKKGEIAGGTFWEFEDAKFQKVPW